MNALTWRSIEEHMPERRSVRPGVCCDSSQSSDVVVHLLREHNVAEILLDSLLGLFSQADFTSAKKPSLGSLSDKLGRA